ncbi:MAG: branched-chain amino acid ABC transporter permease, partial [Deltaproteobacteria bacterium]|nr:branched-chain amino acid ABC transporter permease [Deltaproteobacteria bacterium]
MSGNNCSGPVKFERKWIRPAIIYGSIIVIMCLIPVLIKTIYWLHLFIMTLLYIIVASSFRTISISGQFPLAHAAFMGVGAYFAGMTSKLLGWPPWISIPLGAIFAAGIGALTAFPLARLRTLYYALCSLFLGMALIYAIIAPDFLTGGRTGLSAIPAIFPLSRPRFYYLCLGLTVVSLLALYRFEFSRIGDTLKAIAQSYMVAGSVGINEVFYRVFAVAVGCFFAGLAGATYAHYMTVLSYTSFNLMATLWIVMYVLIGGKGRFEGPILGTVLLFMIPEYFRELKQYVPFITAAILLIVVYAMPEGLV